MDWLSSYWTWILLGFYVAEKIVKESDSKFDDILVDGLKYLATKFYNALRRP